MKRLTNGWSRGKRKQVLKPLNLIILQYRIEEDYSVYCRQKTTKDDIEAAIPRFPKSYLNETVRELARHIV